MFVVVGLGFKVAAAPFQFWVPDVYQGAPTPITAFFSVGSKAVGFIVLLRVVETFQRLPAVDKLIVAMVFLAAATLIYGNLAALPQTNFKRLLGLLQYRARGLLAYGRSERRCFRCRLGGSCLPGGLSLDDSALVSYLDHRRETFRGRRYHSFQWAEKTFAFSRFWSARRDDVSLAGVPLTAGFLGKFLVFKVAYESQQFLLLVLAVITVGCGFYYYLKVVRAMYWQTTTGAPTAIPVSLLSTITIGALVILIFLFGIFPGLGAGLLS